MSHDRVGSRISTGWTTETGSRGPTGSTTETGTRGPTGSTTETGTTVSTSSTTETGTTVSTSSTTETGTRASTGSTTETGTGVAGYYERNDRRGRLGGGMPLMFHVKHESLSPTGLDRLDRREARVPDRARWA